MGKLDGRVAIVTGAAWGMGDAICLALAPILPDRVGAAGLGTSGLALLTGRRTDGSTILFYETHDGGEGATA